MMRPDDLSPAPDGSDAPDVPTASHAMQGQAEVYRREAVDTFRALEIAARDAAAAFGAGDVAAIVNAMTVYDRLNNHAGNLLVCLGHLGSSAGTA
ncbi:hypothetical protein Q8W71_27325 [Methylobacterium sp. NEAU 140]|uniref:hypothetical protein n=1 Tax=Methylobacterium sp. NEAU 140 TaxID=3064945 RepID=UPI0027376D12|nr:hypothetical protein [Methylobacterium sp. NEAU 140]MDP4026340.1 hypothetical protein [Methylobacterium sp. NEAU 140]